MSEVFGIVAKFEELEALKRAAADLRRSGFAEIEAYTPYPVEELARIVRARRTSVLPLVIFVGALLGGAFGYWIQYWDEVLNYPLNVGGRPYNSWPAFTVGTFEIMLLIAVTAGFFGFLAVSRLPMLYHPIFNSRAFRCASRDCFVLCVEKKDPLFDARVLRQAFERFGASSIEEVRA